MEEQDCVDNQLSSSTTSLHKGGVMSLEKVLNVYSKTLIAYNKCVVMMPTLAFNNNQCQYLLDKLKDVTESSNVFLKTSHGALIGSYAPTTLGENLFSFKLLFIFATKIERFIEGCNQDAWIPAAMTLTNTSEYVSSMGFHLELFKVALFKRCGVVGGLSLNQLTNISKDINEIVKLKASIDKEDLLKKISLALPSLHGDKKDLASYLLQRLLRVAPLPSIPTLKSKWDFSQYLNLLRSISKKIKKGVSIGRGASATVFKATWLEMEVAIKVFYGKNNPEFEKEVDILARLCHSNITSMFCYIQEKRRCSIFMELMDGDLFSLMQHRLEVNHDSLPFNIWEAIDIMHQIAEGGKYLHEQEIVHRDLKSSNILVKSVKTHGIDLEYIQAKVADFNVSKIKKSNTTNSEQTMNVGSSRWIAPELIRLQSIGNQFNEERPDNYLPKYPYKCDIYSFAMVCYEILSGELPFSNIDDTQKMKAKILEGDCPKLPSQCPFKLKALIERCWNPEPKSRPTFDDICKELKYVKYILMTDMSFTLEICGESFMDKYGDALKNFNKANELESNNAFTLGSHGEILKQSMGKYADALEDLNKAHELQPNDALTLKKCGNINQMMDKYADALEDLNKAHELQPNDALTLKKRGNINQMMDKYVDALEDFNKVVELEPNDAWTFRNRGEVKRMMGMYAHSLEDFNKANELEPNDAWTLKNRGEVKRMMGMYVDAFDDLNKANKLEANNALTLGSLGEVKLLMGNYIDALEDFNKANELHPNDAWILGNRGDVKRMIGKYEDALEDFNKANELQPYDALTLKRRGDVNQMMDKYANALEDFNIANELEPNDAFTLGGRGKVKLLMNKYVDALEDFNKANELQPNDAWILRNRGEVKRSISKYANALEDFNKANELQPNDAWLLKRRGDVHQMMENYVDALKDFNKADELQLNNAFTLGRRGEVKKMMGKYRDALEDLNKANEL